MIPLIDGRFECQQTGHCCCSPTLVVTLTFKDLYRLFLYFSKDFEQLLRHISFYRLRKKPNKQTLKKLVLKPLMTSDGTIIPSLKKYEGGVCTFYNHPICIIYNSRPLACRNYPFTFITEKKSILVTWARDAEKTCAGIGKGSFPRKTELENIARSTLELITEHNNII
ncbi:MAG: YkgJ family cysteine cluster protein, partial [Candidatus Hodarchaeales archaeon]